jgi:hydroxylamine reductase
MEEEKMITKEMNIGEILRENQAAAGILMESGMHCLGCPSSQLESLEEACAVHGLVVENILDKLNNI